MIRWGYNSSDGPINSVRNFLTSRESFINSNYKNLPTRATKGMAIPDDVLNPPPAASIPDGARLYTSSQISLSVSNNMPIKYTVSNGTETSNEFTYTAPFCPFDIINGQNVTLQIWTDENKKVTYNYSLAGDIISGFEFSNGFGSIEGMIKSTKGVYNNGIIKASANGVNRFVPLYDAKGAAISPDDGIKWGMGGFWQFEISTLGFENLLLSMDAASTKKGPASMSLKYSLDGINFTDIEKNKPLPVTNVSSYYNFYELPLDAANKQKVYFRLVMEEDKRADTLDVAPLFNNEAKGNTYINNIYFGGTKISDTVPAPYLASVKKLFGRLETIGYSSTGEIRYNVKDDTGKTIIADMTYENGINLFSYYTRGEGLTVEAWTVKDGKTSEVKSDFYKFTGTVFANFEAATSTISGTTALSQNGNVKVSMYPNGNNAATIMRDAAYGLKVSASAGNTWASNVYDSKDGYWLIETTTKGYSRINLSLKQTSSSKGPRDFKIEYSKDGAPFIALENSNIKLNKTLSESYIGFELPTEADNVENLKIKISIAGGENMDGYELNDSVNSVGKGNTGIDSISLYGVPVGYITSATLDMDTLRVKFSNKTNEPIIASAVVAFYKESELVEVKNCKINLKAYEIMDEIVASSEKEFDRVKIMSWNDIKVLTPLTKSKPIFK